MPGYRHMLVYARRYGMGQRLRHTAEGVTELPLVEN